MSENAVGDRGQQSWLGAACNPRALGLLLLIIIAVFASRLRDGGHYGRLHIRLHESFAADTTVCVFARRTDGTLMRLQSRPEDRLLWGRDIGWPAVRSLVVAGQRPDLEGTRASQIRLGVGWLDASPLQIQRVEQVVPEDRELEQVRRQFGTAAAVELFPAAAGLNLFSAGEIPVNWLGDFALCGFACVQGAVLWLAVLFLAFALRRIAWLRREAGGPGSSSFSYPECREGEAPAEPNPLARQEPRPPAASQLLHCVSENLRARGPDSRRGRCQPGRC
jgi:hypothetical protein